MNKKSKSRLGKMLELLTLTLAGLFVVLVIAAFVAYFVAKHNFESRYHQALKTCGSQPYVILSQTDVGSVVSYSISQTDSSYRYKLLTFDSVYGYGCSAQAAKNKILSDNPGVSEKDLNIQVSN